MEELYVMTDELLVKLYSEGNNEAFDTLIERHKDKLYAYIFHSVKDSDIANDIFVLHIILSSTTSVRKNQKICNRATSKM